jgi:beta-ureidopropionase
MPRIVRCSIIQASNAVPATEQLARQKEAMIEKHLGLIRKAASHGAQIVCLQEIFNGPYFCAEQSTKWYEMTEAVPSGPTVTMMQALAKELHIAMVVPVYEVEQEGIFYNTAAVIQNDGTYLGKYRKTHIPHVAPGFWEKFYFRPGNLGYPVFDLGFAKIGVYICYDRHFPEGARCLGLNGAEIVFNPCGNWSSRRTQRRMATLSRPSIAWALRRLGTLASFTGRVILRIRAARLLRKLRATRMKC